MITFLNSAILFGLAAVGLPILIHVLSRRKPKRVYFSSLRFLKLLQRQQIKRLKLRQLLLLILRSLILLFVILAFARPTLKGSYTSLIGSEARTSMAIILDNSFSMEGETDEGRLLEVAKRKALQILGLLREGDEAFLILPSATPSSPAYDLQRLKDRIEEVDISFKSFSPLKTLKEAERVLSRRKNFNREIYLISDFQRINFNGKDTLRADAKIFLLPVYPELKKNFGIERVQIADQIIEPERPIEIEAVVKNYGVEPVKDLLVQVYLEGERVGQSCVNLRGRSSKKVIFKVLPEETGGLTGWVEIERDPIPADNRRYFYLFIPRRIKTLLAGGNKYIKLALNPTRRKESFVKLDSYQSLRDVRLTDYDVIILSNVPDLPPDQVQAIKEFLAAGKGLILFPGTELDLKKYNNRFLSEVGLPLYTETLGRIGSRDSHLSFGWIDYDHPLFHGLFEERRGSIDSPHFYFVLNSQRDKGESIINYSNGSPFLQEIRVGDGKVLFFTCAVDLDWSDLPYKAIFAPLMDRCVRYLASGRDNFRSGKFIGEELTCVTKGGGDFLVERPDGGQIKVRPEIAGDSVILRYNHTDIPGFYRFLVDKRPVAVFPVNPNPEESNLERIDLKKAAELLNAQVIPPKADIRNVVLKTRHGRELWRLFLILALSLILVEMLIAREKTPEDSK